VYNTESKTIVSKLDYNNLDTLEISGKGWKKFNFKTYNSVTYPQFDVTNITKDYINNYDFIIAEQVFEHVKHPYKGIKNIFNMLRKDGYFFISTPFFLKLHGCPEDYWRWTPQGLSLMLQECGFTIEELGSWGNVDCVINNFSGWEEYSPGLNLDNDLETPVIVWCLGKKQ
jgi:SAM-dependent methyltransferase